MIGAFRIVETEDGGTAEICLIGILIQGSEELGAPVERSEIHNRKACIAIEGGQEDGQRRHDGGHPPVPLGDAEFLERSEGDDGQNQQDHVFPETLGVGKVDSLAEAAAVHGRVLDPEGQGKKGEKAQHPVSQNGRRFAKHPGNEADGQEAFQTGRSHSHPSGGGNQGRKPQKLEILRDDERRPHRVHQLEEARQEEDYPQDDSRMAAETLIGRLHTRNGSTAALILSKMSSGGSISPRVPEQSMRRNLGSRAVSATYISLTACWKAMEASWMSWAPER